MRCQRHLLGLVVMLTGVASAQAQTDATLRWRSGSALGVQVGQGQPTVPCGSFSISCDSSATLGVYGRSKGARTLSMQLGYGEGAATPVGRPQELNLNLVGRAAALPELGVYGRLGTTFNRPTAGLAPRMPGDAGVTYGVGLSWDFSRSASALVGVDSYDLRTNLGEGRDVRTSLGLRWRY